MRRDVFLHFLNRDTREVFDLYQTLTPLGHAKLMRRALNVAAILCEERCIAPPGFVVEDQIAFELAENQRAFLREGLIQLPMRESNLAEFAEKKRVGYEPMRDRYSGLFNDTRIGFLGDNAIGIIGRKSHVTEKILEDWTGGPEARKKIWEPAKKILLPSQIDIVAKVPSILDERGVALTWSAIMPELPPEAMAARTELRDTLQHIYFKQYCDEFRLLGITDIPMILRDFRIPAEPKSYSYRRLDQFLGVFELREVLFDAPADLIISLRSRAGFIAMMDAYVELAKLCKTDTDLKFHAGRARQAISYGWDSIKGRQLSFYDGSDLEISELASVMDEVANNLTDTHGLSTRVTKVEAGKKQEAIRIMTSTEPELVFFVALEEELGVLAKSLGLKKVAGTPEAEGELDGVSVGVICPRSMGRVAAAVSMASYLAARNSRPRLIIIVGLAGGFEENGSEQGQVIVVEKVIDLALRKVSDEEDAAETHFRPEEHTLHDQLLKQIFSDDLDQDAWAAAACTALDWPKGRRPSIFAGPLACADEVIASNNWRQQILSGKGNNSKLLGVEMEAGGVCAAARKAGVPVSMLRVVSDQADPAKADDSWRKRGMATLADLIKNIPMRKVLDAVS